MNLNKFILNLVIVVLFSTITYSQENNDYIYNQCINTYSQDDCDKCIETFGLSQCVNQYLPQAYGDTDYINTANTGNSNLEQEISISNITNKNLKIYNLNGNLISDYAENERIKVVLYGFSENIESCTSISSENLCSNPDNWRVLDPSNCNFASAGNWCFNGFQWELNTISFQYPSGNYDLFFKDLNDEIIEGPFKVKINEYNNLKNIEFYNRWCYEGEDEKHFLEQFPGNLNNQEACIFNGNFYQNNDEINYDDGIIKCIVSQDEISNSICSSNSKECQINSISWRDSSVKQGENANFIIKSNNCKGKIFDFNIFENDLIQDDFIDSKSIYISNDEQEGSWIAFKDFEIFSNPEYFLEISNVKSSNNLIVENVESELVNDAGDCSIAGEDCWQRTNFAYGPMDPSNAKPTSYFTSEIGKIQVNAWGKKCNSNYDNLEIDKSGYNWQCNKYEEVSSNGEIKKLEISEPNFIGISSMLCKVSLLGCNGYMGKKRPTGVVCNKDNIYYVETQATQTRPCTRLPQGGFLERENGDPTCLVNGLKFTNMQKYIQKCK